MLLRSPRIVKIAPFDDRAHSTHDDIVSVVVGCNNMKNMCFFTFNSRSKPNNKTNRLSGSKSRSDNSSVFCAS